MRFPTKLTPITRLGATLVREGYFDPSLLEDKILFDYVERRREAETRRDNILKSLVVLDAFIVIILSGVSLNIPFFNIAADSFPLVLEIMTLIASVAAFFSVLAFVNVSAYDQLIYTIQANRELGSEVDADYRTAALHYFEFFPKLFRNNSHVSGFDFYIPGRSFRFAMNLFNVLVMLLFLAIPILHFYIVYWSLSNTISSSIFSFGYGIYYFMVCMLMVLGLFAIVLPWAPFKFEGRLDLDEVARQRRGE